MKNKTRFTTIIYLGIAIFIVLGCQIASQGLPDSAPNSTSVPTSTATQVPSPTATMQPDISSAVLNINDLPAGFEEYTLEDMGMSLDDFSNESFQPENVFIFINMQEFQMVFGFNFLLTNMIERAAFGAGVSQPDITFPAIVNGIGSVNVRDEQLLDGLEDIGEEQIGMNMIADMEGASVQVDVLMFRRDIIGAMVLSMNLEEQTPIIAIHELGQKLDQHVKESLQSIK